MVVDQLVADGAILALTPEQSFRVEDADDALLSIEAKNGLADLGDHRLGYSASCRAETRCSLAPEVSPWLIGMSEEVVGTWVIKEVEGLSGQFDPAFGVFSGSASALSISALNRSPRLPSRGNQAGSWKSFGAGLMRKLGTP